MDDWAALLSETILERQRHSISVSLPFAVTHTGLLLSVKPNVTNISENDTPGLKLSVFLLFMQ